MALRYLSAVAENRAFTASEKLVLLCLADHADEDGLSWPSIHRIETWTSLDRKTIFSTLQHMEKAGILARTRRHGQVNRYRLALAMIHSYTSPKNGSSAEIGTSARYGTTTSPKNGTGVVPKTVPGTVIEPSLEPSLYTGAPEWLTKLREIPGWPLKGESHVKALLAWVQTKNWTAEQLERSAIGLAGVQEKTMKGYVDLAAAFQRRLNQGYDEKGNTNSQHSTPNSSRRVEARGHEFWEGRGDKPW